MMVGALEPAITTAIIGNTIYAAMPLFNRFANLKGSVFLCLFVYLLIYLFIYSFIHCKSFRINETVGRQ